MSKHLKTRPKPIAMAVSGAFAPFRLPPVELPPPQRERLTLNVAVEEGAVRMRMSANVNVMEFTVDEARQLAQLLTNCADALTAAAPTTTPEPA